MRQKMGSSNTYGQLINALSANLTKWSNTLKQFAHKMVKHTQTIR